jgi:hypothetical protein
MRKHGEEISRRVESVTETQEFVLPDGSLAEVSLVAKEQPVVERFCERCGVVECKGIIFQIICPVCKAGWNEVRK